MPDNSAHYRMADRLAGGRLDDVLLELVAEGVTPRTIASTLAEQYGIEASHPTVAKWIDNLPADLGPVA